MATFGVAGSCELAAERCSLGRPLPGMRGFELLVGRRLLRMAGGRSARARSEPQQSSE